MNSLLPDSSNINIKESESKFQQAFDNYWHTDVTKHDAIHTIYRYYEKDPGVLIRFCQVIQRMGVINGI